jgi:hypothetical protein
MSTDRKIGRFFSRIGATTFIALVSFLAGVFTWAECGYGTPGSTRSGGLFMPTVVAGHSYGLELWGHPGIFNACPDGCEGH